jgi:hypothetical protein
MSMRFEVDLFRGEVDVCADKLVRAPSYFRFTTTGT